MNPIEAESILAIEQLTRKEFLDSLIDPSNYENSIHCHYTVWLGILYFEEHTLWVDEVLSGLGGSVQKTWKQAHYYHRREETQHVLTDQAYIYSLGIRYEERFRWSKSFFQKIFTKISHETDDLIRLVEIKFPDLTIHLSNSQEEMTKRLVQRLSHRLFKGTRSVAPYIDSLLSGNSSTKIEEVQGNVDIEDGKEWLRKILANILDCSQSEIPFDEEFTRLGLDSLGHLSLASEIEHQFDIGTKSTVAFRYPTINSLAEYISGHIKKEVA